MGCVTPCAVRTTSLPIMSNAVPNLFEVQVGSLTIEPGMQLSPLTTCSMSSSSLDHFPSISSSLSSTLSSKQGTYLQAPSSLIRHGAPLRGPSRLCLVCCHCACILPCLSWRKRTPLTCHSICRHRLVIELSLAEARSREESDTTNH